MGINLKPIDRPTQNVSGAVAKAFYKHLLKHGVSDSEIERRFVQNGETIFDIYADEVANNRMARL